MSFRCSCSFYCLYCRSFQIYGTNSTFSNVIKYHFIFFHLSCLFIFHIRQFPIPKYHLQDFLSGNIYIITTRTLSSMSSPSAISTFRSRSYCVSWFSVAASISLMSVVSSLKNWSFLRREMDVNNISVSTSVNRYLSNKVRKFS